ncbi:hypothetical protein CANCADRAFT_26078 [Tortispora caseinolytica NRRL Y-17796]|uniref:Major facilitator superfamily (MFS) profile domain-containing protein n=1 Tax=Tortispora caseinolytica NRRL Y-17796 TaxID=767744 RepID=A0A1E4TGZ1_9ASCO|nr:hypothetical protein CANCADRAFT_26078 [Tortispora caseinolytica NRRL Y-17796]
MLHTDSSRAAHSLSDLPPQDFRNFCLLCTLYLLQGIPVGLAFGSVPFLLKTKLSYGQVGVFSLASYPYSLKLLWSPIVDAIYSPTFGRRKSWIVPIQTISSFVLLYLGGRVDSFLDDAENSLGVITLSFFVLVLLCATQDIAVDGWALTLMTSPNLSYASTAQTIGLNTGYFLSFTIFLALNSPEFANKYIRTQPIDQGLVSLNQYLRFSGWAYIITTILLVMLKKEDRKSAKGAETGWRGIISVYKTMWKVVQLPAVRSFIAVHLLAKFGFQANDAVLNLKLLEKGLSKEDLAVMVLIDFPFEIIFGYYAARWSVGDTPLQPWMTAFIGRLGCAFIAQILVWMFPKDGPSFSYLLLVILQHILASFMSTVMFVCINAFHAKVADPTIGGTYMTTLNTISNLGGQWPRIIVLYCVDWFTFATYTLHFEPFSCAAEQGRQACKDMNGVCHVHWDGYYMTNVLCITLALAIFFSWMKKKVIWLQSLDLSKWRVS